MKHEQYMQKALELARHGLGRTWPNPSVGCVIIKNDEIIASGRTADSGRPHAETLVLRRAGVKAQGATIYITLEPCSHHGRTPPCAEEIIKYKPDEVIIGCVDPDPRVNGQGIEILKAAGLKVTTGILENECREVNKGFFKSIEKGLPYVMLKAAISADGKYLPGKEEPRWVTGEEAREEVHRLRSQYDAVLTGTGTVLADNPHLNCRLPGLEDHSPLKIIVGNNKIPNDANIFKGREVWIYETDDLEKILHNVAEKGITRIMIEAGPSLTNSLLEQNLVDEIILFQSPDDLGDNGKVFFKPGALKSFKEIRQEQRGGDTKIIFRQN